MAWTCDDDDALAEVARWLMAEADGWAVAGRNAIASSYRRRSAVVLKRLEQDSAAQSMLEITQVEAL